MTRLLDIVDEMRETQAELVRLEEVLAENPQFESLQLDLMSLQKRQRRLEEEFHAVANERQLDILNYKLVPTQESRRVPVLALASALESLQWVISTVFDAFKNGPKKRGRISAESIALSQFDFAYAGSGSVSLVLSVPNERFLVGETIMDESIRAFFEAAQADTREQISEFARRAGIPSVRRLYEWSGSLAEHGVSADIQWRRREELRGRLSVQNPRLRRIREIIEESSDVETETVEITGALVGLDVDLHTFHLKVPNAPDIDGRWSDEFHYDPDIVLERRYRARLIKRSRTYYAYEREEITWELVSLSDPG
jgi:hypothetical protein